MNIVVLPRRLTSNRAAKMPLAALFLLLLQTSFAFSAIYYVATDGNDANTGAIGNPFATIQRAQQAAAAGDTVYIRGGTYTMTEAQIAKKQSIWAYVSYLDKSGAKDARIKYWAYPGEKPVFDFTNIKPANLRVTAFYVSGSWLHFKGLEVTGVQVTILTHTQSECFENQGSNNIYEMLSMHDGQAIGIYCLKGSNNLFLNCDAYRNWDYTSETGKGGNVDGFGGHPSKGSTGNVFRGCRAWFNSDDGFDLINASESVTFENCWAFYNGYSTSFGSLGDGNGFKAGGYGSTAAASLPNPIPRHVVRFCLAVRNKANGFYANHHVGGGDWFNNSAYRNSTNFNMLCRLSDNVTDTAGYGHVMKNNLGYLGSAQAANLDSAQCDVSYNYFTLNVTVAANDFLGLDESQLTQPRQANGDLPDIAFMHLTTTSDLIDKGTNIGFPFSDLAPDLGAFEKTPIKIQQIMQSGADILMTIQSTIGRNYQLQSAPALPGGWVNSGAAQAGSGSALLFTDIGGATLGQRFYRIQASP